jgi:histidine ammonia-lyase
VINSRGSPGEGDLPMVQGNIRAALIGEGEAHYFGRRMSAREALARAGLQPLTAAVDSLGVYTAWPYNAYTDGQTALLVHDIKEMLDWGDLTYAMAMTGLNSSVTPLTAVPQEVRPFPYHNWQARRLLNLLRGSYLFDFEGLEQENRIIQDPLSFRDYNHRNGAVWQVYDQLKSDLLIELNSSHRNPSVKPGARPSDSWELDTPWVRRYYVEPGSTEGGFILSSANFNETTRDNNLQAFVMALAESIAGTTQRVQRFEDPFFTVIAPSDVLSEQELVQAAPRGQGYTISDLMAELQALANPVPAQGNPIQRQVEDMQSFGRQKVERARLAVNAALHLIGQELLSATYWMNVRETQDPERSFGEAPTAAWEAFRAVIPWQMDPAQRPVATPGNLAYAFMRGNPAAQFMGEAAAGPDVNNVGADGSEDVAEPAAPSEEEVRSKTDNAVREEGAPQRNLQGEVRRLRRRANAVEREIRELRRQARRRGDHAPAGAARTSRPRTNGPQALRADRE